ncbi:unnamed protein product [Symbiodinium natans]|uniref:Uncharacterized protein n=1 Tax=Symbiodinium natans TaxID=878477 RepID=A0A812UKL9_9DINO|nr:unnamed protein product [Symbiodinium natans]
MRVLGEAHGPQTHKVEELATPRSLPCKAVHGVRTPNSAAKSCIFRGGGACEGLGDACREHPGYSSPGGQPDLLQQGERPVRLPACYVFAELGLFQLGQAILAGTPGTCHA